MFTNHRIRRTIPALLLAASAAAPALAQPDRILDTPTGWIWRTGTTGVQIDTDVGNGWRPFAINRTAAGTYDVVSVANSGDYAVSGFGAANTLFGTTPATVAANLSGRRIVDLECFDVGGQTTMSVVTVPNTGAGSTGWGWLYDQSSAQSIVDWVANSATPIRIIDLEKYTVAGQTRWAAVAVNNTGAQAKGWWWYFGQTASQVSALLTQNSARLIDIVIEAPPTASTPALFDVVMVADNPGAGWFYPAMTSAQVADAINQNGARLTALERYQDALGHDVFAVAMVDNLNAQSRRMRAYMDSALSDGVYGFALKQVGGPVLAALNQDFAFEPASMLKIVHGSYLIRQCSLNQDSLQNSIWIEDTCNNNECPDPSTPCASAFEPLGTSLAEMLQQSDNNRTMDIEMRYGRATLNSYAAGLGLTNTHINHRLGCLCGNPFNSFSCTDATSLYEKIADGTLFDSTWRDALFARMLNLDGYGYNAYPTLSSIITQEAAATSLTFSEIQAFRDAVRMANKGGGYSCNGTYYRTDGAWASIPFKVSLGQLGWFTVNREYTIAAFVHGNTSSTESNIAYSAKEEILREQIREALQSWDAACSAPSITGQPGSMTRTAGAGGTLTVSTTGTASAFQWQKSASAAGPWSNVANAAGHIAGATAASLAFTNLTLADAGYYRVQVTSACGSATSNAARLTVNPCAADFNASGAVTVQDIFDFLAAYFAGSASADINGSGGVTVQDIFDFLAHYFAGC